VLPSWSALKASWPVVSTWGHWRKVIPMSLEDWAWCFTHQLSEAEQKATYDAFVVPDYARADRGPLLIVSGDADRTVTADMNKANHGLYARGGATTELMPMTGRSHWTLAEPGWEEVADKVIGWVEDRLGIERA
jgi:alpha-beta hydrolase superfamily lysophospholipase